MVERNLAKVDVAGPIPVSRSKLEGDLEETQIAFFLFLIFLPKGIPSEG